LSFETVKDGLGFLLSQLKPFCGTQAASFGIDLQLREWW
jgi:hypothetical protein